MSTFIAIKLRGSVVLATDSRAMYALTGQFAGDNHQKLFEVGNGLFYAFAGDQDTGMEQMRIATMLARGMGGNVNIRVFEQRLNEECQPLMTAAGHRSRKVSWMPGFHAYALAGLMDGHPDFISRDLGFKDGSVTILNPDRPPENEFFLIAAVRGEKLGMAACDPRTWAPKGAHVKSDIVSQLRAVDATTGAIAAGENLIAHLARVDPEVGGAVQMICIDQSGYRWIHCSPEISDSNCLS